jgi:hypothetical protein
MKLDIPLGLSETSVLHPRFGVSYASRSVFITNKITAVLQLSLTRSVMLVQILSRKDSNVSNFADSVIFISVQGCASHG